ncbi:MAG: DUF934 domain-containing protein [Proteobacteria bacterium]|nr:DUF934 domain-containing protein [Pseudomonadota bacterium]
MPLLKDGKLIDDPWVHVADEVAVPASGPVIVGLKRWRAERETLLKRADPVGVRLQSDHTAGDVAEDLEHLGVVALAFPAFTDGRAYTNARRLRERHGYTGEVRAIGNVLRDQYLFMGRCGFDALEVKEGETEQDWQRATGVITVFFQPAADGRETVMQRRHGRAT